MAVSALAVAAAAAAAVAVADACLGPLLLLGAVVFLRPEEPGLALCGDVDEAGPFGLLPVLDLVPCAALVALCVAGVAASASSASSMSSSAAALPATASATAAAAATAARLRVPPLLLSATGCAATCVSSVPELSLELAARRGPAAAAAEGPAAAAAAAAAVAWAAAAASGGHWPELTYCCTSSAGCTYQAGRRKAAEGSSSEHMGPTWHG
jgi:hypothetical protein